MTWMYERKSSAITHATTNLYQVEQYRDFTLLLDPRHIREDKVEEEEKDPLLMEFELEMSSFSQGKLLRCVNLFLSHTLTNVALSGSYHLFLHQMSNTESRPYLYLNKPKLTLVD